MYPSIENTPSVAMQIHTHPLPRASFTDRQVLGMLAAEMGENLGADDLGTLHAQIAGLGLWGGARGGVVFIEPSAASPVDAGAGCRWRRGTSGRG